MTYQDICDESAFGEDSDPTPPGPPGQDAGASIASPERASGKRQSGAKGRLTVVGHAHADTGQVFFLTLRSSRPMHVRDTVVNRILDWAEQARLLNRLQRSNELTRLAWEAYETLP